MKHWWVKIGNPLLDDYNSQCIGSILHQSSTNEGAMQPLPWHKSLQWLSPSALLAGQRMRRVAGWPNALQFPTICGCSWQGKLCQNPRPWCSDNLAQLHAAGNEKKSTWRNQDLTLNFIEPGVGMLESGLSSDFCYTHEPF